MSVRDHSPQDEIALHCIQSSAIVRHTHPKEIMGQRCLCPTMQWGLHQHTAACKCQQKRDCLTPCQGWYWSWRQCVTPPCVFNAFIQIRSAQLAYPLALITSVPDSLPTMDPIYPYMVHSMGPSLGSQTAPGSWPNRVKSYWYVADTPGPAILGLPSSKKLAVMKIICAISQVTQHTSCTCFHYSGHNQACYSPWSNQVHQVHWWLVQQVPRLVQGHWQIPQQIQDLTPSWCTSHDTCPQEMPHCLTSEGQGAPQQDGIPRCDHPCRWTNGLGIIYYLCPEKANGKLCLCLDPHDLNKAICHDHHKTPTMEEVAHEFAHSCFFTKLDAHHGYWSIVLDQDSSFNSPFGRYHFLWLPFGLVCSQDIFQKKMDQILKECQGCIRITDDITVHGCTEAEHDACLQDLMHIACKYNLVFNPQKTHVKAMPSTSLAVSMMPMESTQTQAMLMLYTPCQHPSTSLNFRSS